MPTIRDFLGELEQEADGTKRALERVSNDKLTWKPHEKSLSLGQLALHIATLPGALAEISMLSAFKEIARMPRGQFLRSVLFNHWYHHRGQLTVYLRETGALVPAIYGPSADEVPFQM